MQFDLARSDLAARNFGIGPGVLSLWEIYMIVLKYPCVKDLAPFFKSLFQVYFEP